MKSRKTEGPAAKPRRYALVSSRIESQGARIRRFRLMQMEGLPRLESLGPVDSRSNPAS